MTQEQFEHLIDVWEEKGWITDEGILIEQIFESAENNIFLQANVDAFLAILAENDPEALFIGRTEVPPYIFNANNNLHFIKIPEGITKIGAYAFLECGRLEEVYLPSTIRIIDKGAFAEIDHELTIHYNGTEAEWDKINRKPRWGYNSDISILGEK